MSRLTIRRVKFCHDADTRLKYLKSKTGITPNLLCRIGFCLSLEEPGVPDPKRYQDQGREINRYTLTGQFDEAFDALLRQRMQEDGLDLSEIDEQFSAHMNRGVSVLGSRVRGLADLSSLLP